MRGGGMLLLEAVCGSKRTRRRLIRDVRRATAPGSLLDILIWDLSAAFFRCGGLLHTSLLQDRSLKMQEMSFKMVENESS